MRLLVTGGAGFIGSTYVRHVLASSDDHVTVLDALTYAGNRENLADVEQDPRFAFVHGDICDRSVVDEVLAGHDAVVHFAAESHVDRSLLDPDVFVRTNCDGTNVMCDLAARHEVERFVHVSTDEVYGSIEVGSFVETDRLSPRSPYSAAKAGSDLIALAHHETHGLPAIICRGVEPVRPLPVPREAHPALRHQPARRPQRPALRRRGEHPRLAVRPRQLRSGGPGAPTGRRRGDLQHRRRERADEPRGHRAVLELLDCTDSRIDHVEDRLGHDRRYSISSEKVAALGWSPRTAFADGLEETVAFYRDRREWWEPLLARVRNR